MQSVPVQSWTFEQESVIRIGRSTDNHVILYSAVVSRHHVEIRKNDSGWEIVNLGANGTYLEGRRITQVPVEDGVIIRLARSGPNIQIYLGPQSPVMARSLVGESTVGQRARSSIGNPVSTQSDLSPVEQASSSGTVTNPPITQQPSTDINGSHDQPEMGQGGSQSDGDLEFQQRDGLDLLKSSLPYLETTEDSGILTKPNLSDCCYRYLESDRLFCLDCGKPLRVLGEIADYQVLKTLEETNLGLTQLAWREGRTVLLVTLSPEALNQPAAADVFAQEARQLLQISHPVLPRFLDLFYVTQQPYLAIEPIYGQTLQQFVATAGPLPQMEAISFTLQICDALNYLHQKTPPILHLALKPDHLIRRAIASPASLSITGFLPSRRLDLSSRHLSADYAAPEQEQGQASPASDLYALGPTLTYLLTGNPPSTFYAHREQGFRFYPEYIPGLNPDLASVIRKLTHPQPQERFATVQALADALQQIN